MVMTYPARFPLTTPAYRQQGLVLLGFLMLLVLGSTLLFLGVFNNRSLSLEDSVVMSEMQAAKEALIAYAAFTQSNYGSGFGRLVCQDGNNDGAPAGNELNSIDCIDRTGRLPVSALLPDGSTYYFTDYGRDLDQQFWYRVSPAYLDYDSALNSGTAGQLTLNGNAGVVAVLLAPGEALTLQDRNNTNAAFYPADHLDAVNGQNQGLDYDFVSVWAANPENFNDRVVAIYSTEIMSLITPQVASDLFQRLEVHYDTVLAGSFPTDQAAFGECMSSTCNEVPIPDWYIDDAWQNVISYQYLDAENATLVFAGCKISFELQHNTGVTRSATSC